MKRNRYKLVTGMLLLTLGVVGCGDANNQSEEITEHVVSVSETEAEENVQPKPEQAKKTQVHTTKTKANKKKQDSRKQKKAKKKKMISEPAIEGTVEAQAVPSTENTPENVSQEPAADQSAADTNVPEETKKEKPEENRKNVPQEPSRDSAETDALKTEETDTTVTTTETENTPPQEVPQTYQGYLMDQDCMSIENPSEHETACMLMPTCRASGYGLLILQADGSRQFYMFDEKGQEWTYQYCQTTEREADLRVEVTGILKDGILAVETIREI